MENYKSEGVPESSPEKAGESPIMKVMEENKKTAGQLMNNISLLIERLSPVLVNEEPCEKEKEGEKDASDSEVERIIEINTKRLSNMSRRVSSALDRLRI